VGWPIWRIVKVVHGATQKHAVPAKTESKSNAEPGGISRQIGGTEWKLING